MLAVGLLGCPPREELTLVNNSGEDLSVEGANRRYVWNDGEMIHVGGDRGPSWDDIAPIADRNASEPQLVVEWKGSRLVYELALPPLAGPFLDRSTGLYRSALQLQPDRTLHAVYVGTELPVQTPPPQPEGYPLVATVQDPTD